MGCRNSLTVCVCVLAVCSVASSPVLAGDPVHKTLFSTNEPLEVPGMMLEPGRYTLKLIEQEAQRNVLQVFDTVQLWSSDETRLISTVLTMANYDLPTTDQTVFSFFERGPKQAKALRLWFAPGRNYSQEFVYPKAQAVEMAKAVGRGVLSMPPELPGDIGRLARMVVEPTPVGGKAPLVIAAPAPRERVAPPEPSLAPGAHAAGLAQTGSTPPAPNYVSAAKPMESRARSRRPAMLAALPGTGSFLPLAAVFGALALTMGVMLRRLNMQLERR